jgi:rod shape-determining protein MreD
MSLLVKTILRFVIFIFIQAFVLNNVLLHQLVTPYLYFLFVIWLPFRTSRALLMFAGFVVGFTLDSFLHQPGFHAAACVVLAYLRPFLVSIFIPQKGGEANFESPSPKSMGGYIPYMTFVAVLTFFHHSWLFLLEAWQFGGFWYFIVKTFTSTLLSIFLVFITELLVVRKEKFLTNTI